MTSAEASRVSVIGLGNMGSALAATLLACGYDVTVWNRTVAKTHALGERGARVAASAAEATRAGPLTIACVLRYGDLREALADLGTEGLGGNTLVNLTWGSPDDAREMEAWVHAHRGTYLDGGIPVRPEAIGRPETALVYSGPASLWARHGGILRAFGGASRHVGEGIGDANVLSLAIPGAFYSVAYGAYLEAAAYAAKAGAPPDALGWMLRDAFRLIDDVANDAARQIAADDYESDQATLAVHLDALYAVREAMSRQSQRATLVNAAIDVMERAVEAGLAERGTASVFPMLRDGG
jgi:3-hydroxyisobutyrate dehydrogenase-like beta-hydroxyacid dehydrogenase